MQLGNTKPATPGTQEHVASSAVHRVGWLCQPLSPQRQDHICVLGPGMS